MKKLLVLSTLTLGTLALTSGSANAALLMLDSFDSGSTATTLVGPAPQTFTDTVSAAGIIGGSRDITFSLMQAANSTRKADLFIDGLNSTLTLSNGSQADADVQLDYGPSLGQTLPSPSTGSFVFPIIGNDAVESYITLKVNGIEVTKPIPSAPPTGILSFPSSLFGNPTTLNDFSVIVSGGVSNDVEIDSIGYEYNNAIPEPMTILGTVFALGALPRLKKAHSKKKA